MMTVPDCKKAFRREMLTKRRAYPADRIEKSSAAIAERLFGTDEFGAAETILCFVSTEIEVGTRPIIERARKDGKRVAVPKCVKGAPLLTFHYIESADELAEGAFGIPEPLPECEQCSDFGGALCIVPALCCDIRGHRMGYGRGYYDRFLAGFAGVSCGVVFEDFMLPEIPTEPTDIPLDIIITDTDIYRHSNSFGMKGKTNG